MGIQKKVVVGLKTVALLGLLISLSACSKRGGNGGEVDEAGGVGDNMRFFGTNLSPEEERALASQRTYYFGYDRFDLEEKDIQSIHAHAKRAVNSPNARIRVEGHTDERGSREYNVALGERRANAVANLLMLKGVGQHQISVVSYGKEKPDVAGHDESTWSKNRRAVIVYEVE